VTQWGRFSCWDGIALAGRWERSVGIAA